MGGDADAKTGVILDDASSVGLRMTAPTFVLVHGASHGAWCFDALIAELDALIAVRRVRWCSWAIRTAGW